MHGPAAMLRLWHTVRHLKFVQVYGRARFRLARPRPDMSPAPDMRLHDGSWVAPAARGASMVGPSALRLLHEVHDVNTCGWDDPAIAKLWRYNLHYFDDLLSEGAASRSEWHKAFMVRWVRENVPAVGTGWEPYPTSLRIINWVKWALAGNELSTECVQSLAVQSRWLRGRLEWHLLGNHLFVNAKALVFAGCFFDGPEADAWLAKGLAILRTQIPEQILADGGQFERSPMYHALALEDMLDLANLAHMFPARASGWRSMVEPLIYHMRRWLGVMCHPDGEISFFNDSAIGIAPSPAQLDAYAQRLGYGIIPPTADGCTLLPESGFVRMQKGPAVVIADVGSVGPDYLPGHAHADTLSFELSLYGSRVLVNSGISEYGTSDERLRQRGTAAHNTVVVLDENSSEVWGGFRVARRAHVFGYRASEHVDQLIVTCSHDGYRRLKHGLNHTRTWVLRSSGLLLNDQLGTTAPMVGHLHFAPGATNIIVDDGSCNLKISDIPIQIQVVGSSLATYESRWFPNFGVSKPNVSVSLRGHGREMSTNITWSNECTYSS